VTFRIRIRGSGPVVAEYECPVHGPFTVTTPRDENRDPPATHVCGDVQEWPDGEGANVCLRMAEWRPSPPMGRVKLASASQGKVAEKPHHLSLDTRELGEGMPLKEWKAKRQKLWHEQRWKRFKEEA
jgi:hypothetical protein